MKSRPRITAIPLALGLAVCVAASISRNGPLFAHTQAGPFRTLIVGGGPDIEHNQAAIESNVRYVMRLLPTGASSRVLFTDGDPQSKNILCEDEDKKTYYRTPQITKIDGPSDLAHVKSELSTMSADVAANPSRPVLLYFTGHGSPNPESQNPQDAASRFDNNEYDLWDHHELPVKTLAGSLKNFPKQTPITLIMVECFSGAFGNLLFEDGDPKENLSDLSICGFFASVAQREAAGCTPEINEANYRDFTSYFFAALSGSDRLGKSVTGADYNHDGKVGMNEAFAYALIHDDSIDTPVCTSDVFLRKFITTKDEDVVVTPYAQVQAWAAPAQLAALTALSKYLDLTGEDRLAKAYHEFRNFTDGNPETTDPRAVHVIRFVRLAKSVVLAHTLQGSSNETVKARFAKLLKAESGNPLR